MGSWGGSESGARLRGVVMGRDSGGGLYWLSSKWTECMNSAQHHVTIIQFWVFLFQVYFSGFSPPVRDMTGNDSER